MECGGNDGSPGVADGDDVDYGEERVPAARVGVVATGGVPAS